jgi:osmotically-inducible protein OsmY
MHLTQSQLFLDSTFGAEINFGAAMKTDSDLKNDVLTELSWDPQVPEARVGVSVNGGVVTLTGHLDSYAEKYATKRAVERVDGVKAIAMELDVIPVGSHQRSDTEIAAAIEHALSWSTYVPSNRVKVVVEKGWVVLKGELDWNFQRRAAENTIRPLKGVVGITNNIHLKEMTAPADLTKRIKDAFTRQATREAKRIEIAVDGGVVTLHGKVHSLAEKKAAEGVTWSAPGVTRVNNELTIGA